MSELKPYVASSESPEDAGLLTGPGGGTGPGSQPRPRITAYHVAIIMDGNGRWAQQRGLPRIEGHRRGATAVRDTVRAARELGLPALTLYAFSEQNWDRPLDEVRGLMQLLYDYVIEEREEILTNNIRLRTIGNTVRLPDFVRLPLQSLIEESAGNRGMVLSLALSYGGRESIVEASRTVLRAVQAGRLQPEDIDEAMLTAAMQTAELPPLDLMIRTSGERRVSNFLLWEGTRSQFYTTQCLWPDFTRQELYAALEACGFLTKG